MKEADLNVYQTMMEVVLRKAPGLYQQLKETDITQQQEKVIQAVVPAGTPGCQDLCDYLRGSRPVEDVYPWAEELGKGTYYGWQYRNVLDRYRGTYGKDDFYVRCLVLMIFKKASIC